MARVDNVKIAAQRLGVHDFYGCKRAAPQLLGHRDLRKKAESELALDHFFRGFDRFHFQNHVWQQACAAEESLAERPVARSAIEENERPRFDLFESRLPLARVRMRGMTH